MALHRLTSITMGVPNVAETAAYYTEFGLTPEDDNWFSTTDALFAALAGAAPASGRSAPKNRWALSRAPFEPRSRRYVADGRFLK